MIGFAWRRAAAIALKETRHIRRDPFTLAMAVGVPVLLVTFFGFVIDFDARDIRVLAVDRDHTETSRAVQEVFSSSTYFRLVHRAPTGNPLRWLDAEKGKAVLVLEGGLGKKWGQTGRGSAQLAIDGADNQTAGIIGGYMAGIQSVVNERLTGRPIQPAIRLETRFLFNPELNSRWFTVPGLAVVVIGILSILLTALTVAREWENGSMELLLATPVRPSEIIVGKLLPYTILGLGGVAIVYLAARFLFGVPFRGSHLLFFGGCLMFLGTTLAQGLVISVVTRQQQIAMQLANMTGMLPSLMLSGFVFPVESMPPFFQGLTGALAPRWFMEICRGIFLKGAGLLDLTRPFLALAVINAVLLTLAVRSFKKDVEP